MVYVGTQVFGIKWRNWKMMFQEVTRGTDARLTYDFPRFYNLYNDPKEEYPLTAETAGHFWVRWPMGEILTEHQASFVQGATDCCRNTRSLRSGSKLTKARYRTRSQWRQDALRAT